MTAKEALLELIRDLSEDDARDAYRILADVLESPPRRPPVSQAEKKAALAAFARLDAGEGIPWEDLSERLGRNR